MNPFTRYWPATILVTTVLAAQASAGTDFRPATPGSQGMSSEALEALAGLIRGYVEQDTVVGAELVVIKNRRLVFHEAFGHRDREDGFHWTKNTICNIRSMSKCLTGAAAQILIDEGKLGLDDAVAKYLPSFDNDKSRAITIRHLLTHRSGLPLTIMDKMFGEYESLRRIADLAGERGPDFEPGSDFQYSDTGSDVLGAVIEVAAEQTLQAYMKERLLKPLQMRDTLVYNDPNDARRGRIASMYGGAQGNWMRFWNPDDDPFYPYAAGSQSLHSTPLDYAKFLAMWMDGGLAGNSQVLSPKAVDRMLTPVSELAQPTGFPDTRVLYGQMAILYADEGTSAEAEPFAFGHNGSDGTWAYAWPDHDLMLLYFTQSRGQATGTRLEEVIDRLLINPGGPAPESEVPEMYKPYLGIYLANFGAFNNEEFTVKVRNGHLAVDIPSQLVFELRDADEQGRWHFMMTEDVAVSFERGADGTIDLMKIHQGGMTFEVPRKGTARAAEMAKALEIPEADVGHLIGWYYHPERDVNIEVLWRDSRLWLIVPGLPDLELLPPDDENRWAIRLQPVVLFTFDKGDDGAIASITRWVGEATLVMPRVEPEDAEPEEG
ncbi:MAG: serine hydrolase domain-containing protein [Planctomycetota bacterium]|jgi:CubicO group peptidase (beta-lactamase class C family)